MSQENKISAKELFKDYVPEVFAYDASVDATYPKDTQKVKTDKKKSSTIPLNKENMPIYTKELLENYVPEVLEYDEELDGSDEHKIRENHLSIKESLLEQIRSAKASRKSNKTTYRQPIRTENEVQ